jgi:predicted lipoprotein
MKFSIVWIVLVAGFVAACKDIDSDGGVQRADRSVLLAHYADLMIVPSADVLTVQTSSLRDSISGFCAAPDATGFAAIKADWQAASISWSEGEVFHFGPAKTLRLDSRLYTWPIQSEAVDAFLAAGSLTKGDLLKAGAHLKGLPVMEYILYGADGARTESEFEGDANSYCVYLTALSQVAYDDTKTLQSKWQVTDGVGFSLDFAKAGSVDSMYGKQQEAVDDLVNRMIHTVQLVEMTKLAKPMGKRDAGVVQPLSLESPYAHISKELLVSTLKGVRRAFIGGTELHADGIGQVVKTEMPDLYTDIMSNLDSMITAFEAMDRSFATSLTEDLEGLEVQFYQSKQLIRLFAVDMAGILAVTPTFSDNDGD